jgi:hypothetical protein
MWSEEYSTTAPNSTALVPRLFETTAIATTFACLGRL